jgi:ABC-type transport system involved in multi-copper enzyme maturation permease subunit
MTRRLLAWEWLLWSTRKDVRIAVAALGLGSLLWSWLGAIAVQSDFVPAFLSGSDATGFVLAYRSMRGLVALLTLFVLLWSSASIAAELESGQLRAPLLRVRRSEFVLSKALHLWLVSSAMLAVLLLLCWLAGAGFFGLQAVRVGPLTMHSGTGLALSGLSALALTAASMAAVIALGVAVSASCGGGRAATTLALCTVAVIWALGQIASLRAIDVVGDLARPWNVALTQAEGLRTSSQRDDLAALLIRCTVCTVSCLCYAVWRFERRDLK